MLFLYVLFILPKKLYTLCICYYEKHQTTYTVTIRYFPYQNILYTLSIDTFANKIKPLLIVYVK